MIAWKKAGPMLCITNGKYRWSAPVMVEAEVSDVESTFNTVWLSELNMLRIGFVLQGIPKQVSLPAMSCPRVAVLWAVRSEEWYR